MIRLERDGPIARIILDAPDRRNALRLTDMAELTDALSDIDDNTELRVAVLTGRGSVFCAGADFAELEAGNRPDIPLTELSTQITALRVPVIGAFNGGVFGAGLDLALACDLRLGVTGMVAQVPAAAIGVHYPGAAIARAQSRLGHLVASRLFLAAERLSDEQCRDAGLVSDLIAPDDLDEASNALATHVTKLAPLSVEGMKRSLNQGDSARKRVTTCFASADHAEALAARRAKRLPHFTRS
ncbi:Enoyl-CoA hydratase/carnithine racemase [Monaibacterium marinum]|uniref:Enoyl-CoA hydratase/carnithine racemase n=1 Tax=Pontivivens marinum TaxID=1690039 RepID=A0A2C9CNH6_9RHOB|nr:enoyl-CoA hydratase-related protein [Monaibacterium marinum]SOH92946.1 Enoyl-CoA hydratase/carnithine racemase [Monaibacterium marinum]